MLSTSLCRRCKQTMTGYRCWHDIDTISSKSRCRRYRKNIVNWTYLWFVGSQVWSFMTMGVKGNNKLKLCAKTIFSKYDLHLLTLKSLGYDPWLCMQFHDDRCKGKAVMHGKPFSVKAFVTLTSDFFALKSWGHILDLLELCVWSFMTRRWREKAVMHRNNFT